jgi:iron complex outermembrane receptor protein
MTYFSRRGLRSGHGYAVLMASAALTAFAPGAHAQSVDVQSQTGETPADADATADIVVVGAGETRSVSTLLPANLDALPPGTSIQKALNMLPGVSAQSIDALGLNEQSMSLQVRGFSTTHLGYTLDGTPLGDGAYNNYNGLTISRALISENLGRADLATGIAGLGIASTSNLGGAVMYTSSNPSKDLGLRISQTVGSENALRTFVRLDTGEYQGLSAYVSGQYARQDLFVDQGAYTPIDQQADQRQDHIQDRWLPAHRFCRHLAHEPGRRRLSVEGDARTTWLGSRRLCPRLADLSEPQRLRRDDDADQMRPLRAAGKARGRNLHQRPDPA